MVRCIGCGIMNPPQKKNCKECSFPLKRHYKKDYSVNDWALHYKIAGEQGDKKEQEKVMKIIKRMRNKKK